MAKDQIVLPDAAVSAQIPPFMMQLSPEIQQAQLELLRLQIDTEREAQRVRAEKQAVKDAEMAARRATALDAKRIIDRRDQFQRSCPHLKQDGKTALGCVTHLPHPVTHQERASVLCSVCEMIEEAPLSVLREKYGPKMPPMSLTSTVSTNTDY